jgi:MATE family multidrug resistance protein
MWMCLVLGAIAMICVGLIGWLIGYIDYQADMLAIAQGYLFAISLCAIPLVLIPAVRGALEGMSQTRVVLWINFAAFLINIPLDYVLVNGLYGFPKLGGVGCAWATVVLIWGMFLVTLLVLTWHKKVRELRLLHNFEMPHRETIAKTLRLGFPIGLSIVIELSMFCGAGMLIAIFGTTQASAHAVAITIASMSYMLYMGLGQGVTIRASQLLGASKPEAAWYTIKTGTGFNVFISVCLCVCFVIFNRTFVSFFTQDPAVIQLAVVLLYFGAAFQIADSLQVAVVSALRAYHDTASPPKYQFFSFWVIGLPLGVGLAFYDWWPGLEEAKGLWLGMVASLFLVGVLLLKRLLGMVHDQTESYRPHTNMHS